MFLKILSNNNTPATDVNIEWNVKTHQGGDSGDVTSARDDEQTKTHKCVNSIKEKETLKTHQESKHGVSQILMWGWFWRWYFCKGWWAHKDSQVCK